MFAGRLKKLVRRRVRKVPRRQTWTTTEKKHYELHKEAARELCHVRLAHFNEYYNFEYKRVAIRNTRSRWGSCSSKKNLNFNYRIMLLPPELQDYLIVHELCHLEEMNHGPQFWSLVAEQVPDYKERIKSLRTKEREIFTRANI